MPARRQQKPNIVLMGIDSLRRDHMSCYGYHRLTTPHIDRFAKESTLFEQTFSRLHSHHQRLRLDAHRHGCLQHAGSGAAPQRPAAPRSQDAGRNIARGRLRHNLRRLQRQPQLARLRQVHRLPGWGSWNEGRSPKAQNLNAVALPELDRLARKRDPFFLFLRHMDPHSPYLPPAPFERMFYHGNEFDKQATSRWSR
jgi:hypothetical protein